MYYGRRLSCGRGPVISDRPALVLFIRMAVILGSHLGQPFIWLYRWKFEGTLVVKCSPQNYPMHETGLYQRINVHAKFRLGYRKAIPVTIVVAGIERSFILSTSYQKLINRPISVLLFQTLKHACSPTLFGLLSKSSDCNVSL